MQSASICKIVLFVHTLFPVLLFINISLPYFSLYIQSYKSQEEFWNLEGRFVGLEKWAKSVWVFERWNFSKLGPFLFPKRPEKLNWKYLSLQKSYVGNRSYECFSMCQ